MTTAKPNILELAKQGNPKAIEALLNRNLQPKGITAKVALKGSCIRIMLEANEIPNQLSLVDVVSNGIKKLGVISVETLQIFGRRTGDEVPSWNQTIVLGIEPVLRSQRQQQFPNFQKNKNGVVSASETNFKVKHNGQELIASSIEELKEWIFQKKITLTDYVYNPILNKWMYVRELAEIEVIIKQQESSTQANQYNKLSFVFAGLGLLMLLVHLLAGIVLLIIGVVFSAMYYAGKGTTNGGRVAPNYTNSSISSKSGTSCSRVTAAILAILLGGLGIHFFYIKAWGWGFISILFYWTFVPAIVGLVLGIRYLLLSDEEFERKAKKVQGAFGPIDF